MGHPDGAHSHDPEGRPAIDPGRELHIHLHGLTPEQLAAIVTQRGAYLEEDQ